MQGIVKRDGSGKATFDVTYLCMVLRPFKGEVVDCIVTSVNKACALPLVSTWLPSLAGHAPKLYCHCSSDIENLVKKNKPS